jgi:predicted nucleotidyltransferase
MTPATGLTPQTLAQIADVLASFPELHRAILFGSRAKGTYKPGSDIDLALVGDSLDWRLLGRVYDALDDLLLPYRFSLVISDEETDSEVAAHIARAGLLIYQRTPARTVAELAV